jgi:hypothetical protein
MRNRPLFVGMIAPTVCAVVLSGCVRQAFYLQQVDMSGSPAPPPVHMTTHQQEGEIRLSPRFAYSTASHLSGQFINSQTNASSPLITSARIGNVNWNIPRVTVGTDVEYFLSDHFGFSGGLSFAGTGGSSFWEGHLGVGLCTAGQNLAARFDAGVQWRSFRYDVQALLVTESGSWSGGQQVTTLKDVWRESQAGFYGGVTLNTCYETSPVNGFLNFGLTQHSFGDLRKMSRGVNGEILSAGFTNRPETGLWMLSLSPGLSFSFSQRERVLFGVRFMTGSELDNANPEFLAIPFLQIDLSL